jgi:hypothetical protein
VGYIAARHAAVKEAKMTMEPLSAFGLFAVSAMLICYALEDHSSCYVLAFAGACYGFLQGAWPFGLVEAVWMLVALRRWRIRSLAPQN